MLRYTIESIDCGIHFYGLTSSTVSLGERKTESHDLLTSPIDWRKVWRQMGKPHTIPSTLIVPFAVVRIFVWSPFPYSWAVWTNTISKGAPLLIVQHDRFNRGLIQLTSPRNIKLNANSLHKRDVHENEIHETHKLTNTVLIKHEI